MLKLPSAVGLCLPLTPPAAGAPRSAAHSHQSSQQEEQQHAATWASALLSENQLKTGLNRAFSTMAALLVMVQGWKEDLGYLKR